MRSLLPSLAAAAALAAAAPGCGDSQPPCKYASYKDLDADPVKVCQTEIDRDAGVCFDAAEICPNVNVMPFCFQKVGAGDYPPVTVQLTNHGLRALTVSSVELVGDARCSFEYHVSPKEGTAIAPGDSMFVEVFYDPHDQGADHVQLRIRSDAENFPELLIGGCGTGVGLNESTDRPCGPPDGFTCQVPAGTDVVDCG